MVSRLVGVFGPIWCGILGAVMAWSVVPKCLAQEQPQLPASDVIVVAQAPSNMKLAELERFLREAIKQAKPCQFDEVHVNAIDPAVYQWLADFFPDVGTIAAPTDKSVITRNKDASQQWNVRIDPFLKLEGIKVRYVDKGDKGPAKEETFPAKGKEDKDARLRFFAPGWWIFQTEPSWEPKEYQLVVANQPEAQPFQPWPLPDQYYAIRLKNFRGDIRTYFETLTDPEKVGTALKDVRVPKATSLLLANFARLIPVGGGIWDGNRFTVLVSRLPGSHPARVWMLFPLTKEQMEEAVKDLKDRDLTSYELAEAIGERKHGYDRYPTVRYPHPEYTLKEATKLAPGTKPQWYEVPPVYSIGLNGQKNLDGFSRTFEIEGIPEWKRGPLAKGASRVIAYEFETKDGATRRILSFLNDNNEEVLWFSQDVPAWPIGLQQAAAASSAAPPPGQPDAAAASAAKP